MTSLVFDTDVLSTFGKIKRLDLLEKLFPGADFSIPISVNNELFKAKDCGYEFVDLNRYTPQLCCGWVCQRNV
jgi:hypothetical protein